MLIYNSIFFLYKKLLLTRKLTNKMNDELLFYIKTYERLCVHIYIEIYRVIRVRESMRFLLNEQIVSFLKHTSSVLKSGRAVKFCNIFNSISYYL